MITVIEATKTFRVRESFKEIDSLSLSSQVAASMKLKSPLISGTSGARIKFPGPREGGGGK